MSGRAESLPSEPKPVRMPNPNDPAILAARKRSLAKGLGRGGRGSTILSEMLNGSQGQLGA